MLKQKLAQLVQDNRDYGDQQRLYEELGPDASDAGRDFRLAMIKSAEHQRMIRTMDIDDNHLRTGNAHDEWGE